MGIGFVIFFHLLGLAFLSLIFAILGGALAYILSSKEKRRRKVLFAAIAPFLGFFTLYFTGLFGSIVVSGIKNVDIGIGDAWYVPLSNNCELLFIDVPEQAFIKCGKETVQSEVELIQLVDQQIFGKTDQEKYFVYNTHTRQLREIGTYDDLIILNSKHNLNLEKAQDFYVRRRNEIAGNAFILVGILALLSSGSAIYLAKKWIVGGNKSNGNF